MPLRNTHRAKQVSIIDWLFVILQEEEDDLESEEDCDEEKSVSPTDWQKAGDLWVDGDGFVILQHPVDYRHATSRHFYVRESLRICVYRYESDR